ncbi:hypothetical protein K0M31_009138 [Melipona bicolor]|uniref:Uncharacterized protein n=1 Tax=Melipona bicolor TaxID=60889 RepID=A0AA40KJM6_9HYME|nr:hypothetical protein K0M31_009138 [Melipona bicolor]
MAVAYWQARVSYLLEVIIVIEEEIRDTIAGRLKIIVVAVVQAVMLGLAELLLPANRRERSVILIRVNTFFFITKSDFSGDNPENRIQVQR